MLGPEEELAALLGGKPMVDTEPFSSEYSVSVPANCLETSESNRPSSIRSILLSVSRFKRSFCICVDAAGTLCRPSRPALSVAAHLHLASELLRPSVSCSLVRRKTADRWFSLREPEPLWTLASSMPTVGYIAMVAAQRDRRPMVHASQFDTRINFFDEVNRMARLSRYS